MTDPNLSTPSTPSTPSAPSELSELKELCTELRWQTHTLRIALLLVATAVCFFFALESRRNGQALKALRPQAAQVIELTKAQEPIINRFLGQLGDFAKANPDFAAILSKYVRATPAAVSPAVPATAPAAKPAAASPAAPAVPKN